MKKKLVAVMLGLAMIVQSGAPALAETETETEAPVIQYDDQTFEGYDALWDYLEDQYPALCVDQLVTGQYADNYVILNVRIELPDYDESLNEVVANAYYKKTDGSEDYGMWYTFLNNEDLQDTGYIGDASVLRNVEDGKEYEGCFYINSDNSYGPSNMLALRPVDDGTENSSSGNTVHVDFHSSVPNDVTGKWRLAIVNTQLPVSDYLISYYQTFFKSDDEIHAIINTADNTTTCVSVLAGMFDVAVHQYIQGEENDAKVLFGGDLISEEFYDKETGELKDF